MTKEQKLKAERLRRAKMFAAIIKSGGNKMNDLATVTDPTNEPAKACPADNVSSPDLQPVAKEREGSSVPFEQEGSIATEQEKDSDDEHNRVRKYRKKHHPESDDEKDDSEESYKHSTKRHRSEHSRSHIKDVHKHKHKSHTRDREPRHHHRRRHGSSEDEHEHRSSKSRRRHRDDEHYSDDDGHRSRRHRRDHRSTKRKHEDDRDQSERTLGRSAASPSTSDIKFESEKPPGETAQSSEATTEVPSELRAKIRAMLLEKL
uniref:Uncharacterized protein n=1 Tax=Arundo donax TaxID=35708 RepID=A0A0A9EUX9_ARUDO